MIELGDGMELVRDALKHKLFLKDHDKTLIEFGFMADEYIMIFYTNQEILISKEDDKDFYEQFSQLLKNTYQFYHPVSCQKENKIIWFSDGTCDIEDEFDRKRKSRFILEQKGKYLSFCSQNPFMDENHITGIQTVIFSPAGNGSFSRNIKTGFSFQDDVVMIHQKLLEKPKVKEKR